MPDGLVVQDALLAVHTVLGDVFAGDPPLGGQVAGIAGVQEGVVAGVGQERLEGEGDDGENAGEEGQNDQNHGDDVLAGFTQIDLGDLTGFAGDGGVVLPAGERQLIQHHDGHAEDHHDDGKDAGFAGILGVHGDVLGGQGAEAQIMGHGVGTHGAAEDQQNGGQNGGLDHGQGDAGHDLPPGGVQNGGGFLKVRVHVAENAADKNVGKGGVVQAQHHHTGEQTLAPPHGHFDAEQGCEKTVGGAGDGVGVKKVLPHHGQRPLWHDIGENKDGTDVLAPCHVGAGDEEGHNATEQNGHDAGAHCQQEGVQQGRPQVGFCHPAGKEVDVVDGRKAGCLSGRWRGRSKEDCRDRRWGDRQCQTCSTCEMCRNLRESKGCVRLCRTRGLPDCGECTRRRTKGL